MIGIGDIDALIAPGNYGDLWGWHDDHKHEDGTERYLPALQQVRSEYEALLGVISALPERRSALQLGMGTCRASHDAWRLIFDQVATIDYGGMWLNDGPPQSGGSTHDHAAQAFAIIHGPYDMLYIDAGHLEEDCALDHRDYGHLVKAGGLIVFHDALPRAAYSEIGVYRYLIGLPVTIVGDEVGTAFLRK